MMIKRKVNKKYHGRWLDLFDVYIIRDKEFPKLYGKFCVSTPDMDYIMTKEQFNEFKRKVNHV